MHRDKNLQILELLANGINPITSETFPADHPCQHPEIIRALFNAITVIKKNTPPPATYKKTSTAGDPAKKGVPWTKEEDSDLIEAFKKNLSMEDLAKKHERSKIAIEKRLMKLGLIPFKYIAGLSTVSNYQSETADASVSA